MFARLKAVKMGPLSGLQEVARTGLRFDLPETPDLKSDLGNPQRNYSLFLHLKERNLEIGFRDRETKKTLDSFQLYLGLVKDQKFALEGIVLLVSRSVHSKASEMGPMFGHS